MSHCIIMLQILLQMLLFLVLNAFLIYSSYGLEDEKFENEHLSSNASDVGQVPKSLALEFPYYYYNQVTLFIHGINFYKHDLWRLHELFMMLRRQQPLPLT